MPILKHPTNNPDAFVSRFSWSVVWLLLVCGVVSSCSTTRKQPTQKWVKKYPKQVHKILNDFRYVDSGRLTMGLDNNIVATESDSTLLVSNYEHTVNVPAFYISDHEVTNAEYREFTNWVFDSIALSLVAQSDPSFYLDKEKKILDWSRLDELIKSKFYIYWDTLFFTEADRYFRRNQIDPTKLIYKYFDRDNTISISIYPDTAILDKEFLFVFGSPLRVYNWHPKYDNYPVIGVSWQQANAYCHWKTERVNEILTKHKLPTKTFRLPTENEWEMAAYGYYPQTFNENIDNKVLFPWRGLQLHSDKGKYFANFGNIVDQNGWTVKWYVYDGEIYTSKVKSYPVSELQLYDMGGNVAEWTSDVPTRSFINREAPIDLEQLPDSIRNKITDSLRITVDDSLSSAFNKTVGILLWYSTFRHLDSSTLFPLDKFWLKWLNESAAAELHDAKVLAAHNNLRIVKGGSWATGPAYMLCSSREVFPENKCSSRIGFRLVMQVGK